MHAYIEQGGFQEKPQGLPPSLNQKKPPIVSQKHAQRRQKVIRQPRKSSQFPSTTFDQVWRKEWIPELSINKKTQRYFYLPIVVQGQSTRWRVFLPGADKANSQQRDIKILLIESKAISLGFEVLLAFNCIHEMFIEVHFKLILPYIFVLQV